MSRTEFVIVNGWLCESSDECTCGSGGFSQHEQYCGIQNVVQVDKLLAEHERFRVENDALTAKVERLTEANRILTAQTLALIREVKRLLDKATRLAKGETPTTCSWCDRPVDSVPCHAAGHVKAKS